MLRKPRLSCSPSQPAGRTSGSKRRLLLLNPTRSFTLHSHSVYNRRSQRRASRIILRRRASETVLRNYATSLTAVHEVFRTPLIISFAPAHLYEEVEVTLIRCSPLPQNE